MSVEREAQNSSNQSIRKIAVTAHLLGRELYRLKLKRLDLPKADLRLGEKAYATGATEGEPELVSGLDRVAERLKQLRQQERQAASTFGEKAKAFASRIAKAVQIGVLHLRHRHILKQLGARLRQRETNSSLAKETDSAREVADRLRSVETEIRQLIPQTYPWARRPLLLGCLLLLLFTFAGAFVISHQHRLSMTQQTESQRSPLSDADMKKILAQQRAFAEQTQQMLAEEGRKERERTQARIAAAERQYKEQGDRERAEVEKRAREQAQREEQARREQAEREKQQAQIAAAEQARLEREQAEAEKLAREKAEREKAEAERAAAAERVRKEEEQRAAQLAEEKRQREEDERAAQIIPASQLITNSDLEAIMGFAMQAPEDREVKGILTKKGLLGVEQASSCFFASTSPKTDRSFNGVMVTVRYLREKDEDKAETLVRETMGKVEFASPDLFFAHVPELGYGGFFYRDFANQASDSIFVFKPTLRGCTLLQVGIDGAPSQESSENNLLWHKHMVDRETKIALKILGPLRFRVASYESRHPQKEEETQSNYLPDIPGVDSKVMRFFNGAFKAAANAEADNIANSKSIVAASGGRKMLCPKCGGSKVMVRHGNDSFFNPYASGAFTSHEGFMKYESSEQGKTSTSIVACDECQGTGVVNAR